MVRPDLNKDIEAALKNAHVRQKAFEQELKRLERSKVKEERKRLKAQKRFQRKALVSAKRAERVARRQLHKQDSKDVRTTRQIEALVAQRRRERESIEAIGSQIKTRERQIRPLFARSAPVDAPAFELPDDIFAGVVEASSQGEQGSDSGKITDELARLRQKSELSVREAELERVRAERVKQELEKLQAQIAEMNERLEKKSVLDSRRSGEDGGQGRGRGFGGLFGFGRVDTSPEALAKASAKAAILEARRLSKEEEVRLKAEARQAARLDKERAKAERESAKEQVRLASLEAKARKDEIHAQRDADKALKAQEARAELLARKEEELRRKEDEQTQKELAQLEKDAERDRLTAERKAQKELKAVEIQIQKDLREAEHLEKQGELALAKEEAERRFAEAKAKATAQVDAAKLAKASRIEAETKAKKDAKELARLKRKGLIEEELTVEPETVPAAPVELAPEPVLEPETPSTPPMSRAEERAARKIREAEAKAKLKETEDRLKEEERLRKERQEVVKREKEEEDAKAKQAAMLLATEQAALLKAAKEAQKRRGIFQRKAPEDEVEVVGSDASAEFDVSGEFDDSGESLTDLQKGQRTARAFHDKSQQDSQRRRRLFSRRAKEFAEEIGQPEPLSKEMAAQLVEAETVEPQAPVVDEVTEQFIQDLPFWEDNYDPAKPEVVEVAPSLPAGPPPLSRAEQELIALREELAEAESRTREASTDADMQRLAAAEARVEAEHLRENYKPDPTLEYRTRLAGVALQRAGLDARLTELVSTIPAAILAEMTEDELTTAVVTLLNGQAIAEDGELYEASRDMKVMAEELIREDARVRPLTTPAVTFVEVAKRLQLEDTSQDVTVDDSSWAADTTPRRLFGRWSSASAEAKALARLQTAEARAKAKAEKERAKEQEKLDKAEAKTEAARRKREAKEFEARVKADQKAAASEAKAQQLPRGEQRELDKLRKQADKAAARVIHTETKAVEDAAKAHQDALEELSKAQTREEKDAAKAQVRATKLAERSAKTQVKSVEAVEAAEEIAPTQSFFARRRAQSSARRSVRQHNSALKGEERQAAREAKRLQRLAEKDEKRTMKLQEKVLDAEFGGESRTLREKRREAVRIEKVNAKLEKFEEKERKRREKEDQKADTKSRRAFRRSQVESEISEKASSMERAVGREAKSIERKARKLTPMDPSKRPVPLSMTPAYDWNVESGVLGQGATGAGKVDHRQLDIPEALPQR